jgi:hypothetical protein
MLYLVQATMRNGREYTHYTCRERANAERLAVILADRRPDLTPVSVVEWEPTPEQLARIYRFADNSEGPAVR